MRERILAVRSDNVGDVLLTEPALRTLGHEGDVTLLCSPTGAPAADLIAAVSETIVFDCPWIVADPPDVDPSAVAELIREIEDLAPDRAVIFTSQRQSPLPMALVLRLAGVPNIAARSEMYGGSLLDMRLRHDSGEHEVERNLELVEALGLDLAFDRRMRVELPESPFALPEGAVVVHPGSSVPARTLDVETWRGAIRALAESGHPVVLTGSSSDAAALALQGEHGVAVDLVGRTSLGQLGAVVEASSVVCIGNTGPMHLAAAVGTPVVAAFPPTVPPERWRPWMVDHVLLGAHDVACAPCYQQICPLDGQPCADVEPRSVVVAVETLLSLGAERMPA